MPPSTFPPIHFEDLSSSSLPCLRLVPLQGVLLFYQECTNDLKPWQPLLAASLVLMSPGRRLCLWLYSSAVLVDATLLLLTHSLHFSSHWPSSLPLLSCHRSCLCVPCCHSVLHELCRYTSMDLGKGFVSISCLAPKPKALSLLCGYFMFNPSL